MKTYTTGKFASLAGVSSRALRFYDQKGLLKPHVDPENHYRHYTEEDLETLQKILLFKKLEFSLEEIGLLIREESGALEALHKQKELVGQKIAQYKAIEEALTSAIGLVKDGQGPADWSLSIIEALNQEEQLAVQYQNANNLSIRILLHEKYSQNPQPWFDWIYGYLDVHPGQRFLECGCGDGTLWKNRTLPDEFELYLSDISQGMVQDARKNLAKNYNSGQIKYLICDLGQIPFGDEYFDAICANHTLFYASDVPAGISEISRVLKPGGLFYASAYGSHHMEEITRLVQEFDPGIYLSASPLYEKFGLENGKNLLKKSFKHIDLVLYDDCLEVTDSRDLADYILSCHGNQTRLLEHYDEFLEFLNRRLSCGPMHITKQAGLFIAKK